MMNSATRESEKSSSLTSTLPCHVFSLAEIQSATNNFDDELVIGQGGFGKVYKGQISGDYDAHIVVIKRLDSMSSQGEHEFRAEINMLSTLRHCNLVSLIGYCDENKEMVLVYEFMPNGTLYHHLHKASTPLSWLTRLKIAIGAARALDYLHTGVGTEHGVIHRDVKSSNILLDVKWAAMISDFGLSKIGPTNQLISFIDASIKGTFGYLDPEYFYTRKLTRKTDVYAFGIVLFELLSGRLPVDERYGEDNCSLVRWARKCVKERNLAKMVDSSIKERLSPKYLRRFTQIAYRCVHPVPKERPAMTEVVASLQALLTLHERYNLRSESSGIVGSTSWKMLKYFASNTDNMSQNEESMTTGIKKFTYNELKLATRDFADDSYFDEGDRVKVYIGWLDKTTYSQCKDNTKLPIAVKEFRYKHSNLKLLKEFSHPNLVKLLGYSLKGERSFRVYEFMSKRNFKDLLDKGAVAPLPLATKDFTAKLSDYDWCHSDGEPDIDGIYLVLQCNLSGYDVIFVEVLTGEHISYSGRISKIDRLFIQYGKEPLSIIAKLCFQICNEVDSESKMLTVLKEHDELIRDRLESWLDDPNN